MTTREPGGPERPLPAQLGKYPISGVLGEGAMGTVYRGMDPVIQREVAIKTIRKELLHVESGVADASTRFRNEARAVGRLAHPGIVAIYEYGEDETTAFIAMEFVQGRNLSQVLADPAAPLRDEALVIRLLEQLLDALACAHAEGVWHRDIKPANLILARGGQLKLTDFGIARIASAGLTQLGSSIGTPGYMAPEQYIGEAIDHRVDLFASGVLLYRLLTGVMPFPGTPEIIMYKTMNEAAPPPSSMAGAIGGNRYDELIARALRKNPDDRFADAAEMRQAILDAHAAAAHTAPADPADATVIVTGSRPATAPGVGSSTSGRAAIDRPATDAQPNLTTRLAAVAAGGDQGRSGNGAGGGGGRQTGTGGPPSRPSTTAGSWTSLALPGWDPVVLHTVEQALTRHVGPIARVLVRQAASRQTELPQLLATLAGHLPPDEAVRRRFLAIGGEAPAPQQPPPPGSSSQGRSATPISGISTATGRGGTGANTGTSAQSAFEATPPTEQMAETARQVLAQHIGPIAKVIVRKVLATQPTRAQFAERLAAQASDGSNQEQLLAQLRRALG